MDQNQRLPFVSVKVGSAKDLKGLDVQVNGLPQTVDTEKPEPRTGNGITVQFTKSEKDEIREKADAWNVGMSTLLYEAWQFFKVFYEYRHVMLRHKDHFIDMAKSVSKNF